MNLTEAIEILRQHNRWRRGAEDVTHFIGLQLQFESKEHK